MQLSDVNQWIHDQQDEIAVCLEELVNKNTYTLNYQSVDEGMDQLCTIAGEMGFQIEVVNARHRLIKTGGTQQRPRILFVTHIDTVHPPESGFLKYENLGNGIVRGPGIGDIKGGIVMGLWAMQAIQAIHPDCDLRMVVSADEEIASPTIKDWYMQGKSNADYVLGLEPGFPQGPLGAGVTMGVVKQRKGTHLLHFKITGKAAHSGGAWEMGLSAIDAMARRIPAIHELTDLERGITTNVGIIKGGTAQNTIAEECMAEVNLRFYTTEDGNELIQAVKDIINQKLVYNQKLDQWEEVDIYYEDTMPPMESTVDNQKIVDIVLEEGKKYGQDIVPIVRGGGSDANYLSADGTPTICGMGAPASGIHTTAEQIYLPLLYRRLELLIHTTSRIFTEDPCKSS